MHFSQLCLAAGLLQAAIAAVLPRQVDADDDFDVAQALGSSDGAKVNCATVQIIAARGTTQDPGEGSMTGLSNEITSQIPGSASVGLRYPASMSPTYENSENKGVDHMQAYIKYFSQNCPNTKIVVLGYSQGAQVTMDALCGSTTGMLPGADSLAPQFRDNVHAVVVWGDPSHTAGEPYNRGTSSHNGIFPRNAGGCSAYAGKIRSYCDSGDPYCDSGNYPNAHKQYAQKYEDASAKFVVNKVT